MAVSGVYASNHWYKLDQAWDQSRAAISRQFLDASSLLNSAMTSAMDNQISGTASLAAQAALKRIKAKTAIATGATSSTATSASKRAALAGSTVGKSGSSISASNYRYTSSASILSSSNVVNFFA